VSSWLCLALPVRCASGHVRRSSSSSDCVSARGIMRGTQLAKIAEQRALRRRWTCPDARHCSHCEYSEYL